MDLDSTEDIALIVFVVIVITITIVVITILVKKIQQEKSMDKIHEYNNSITPKNIERAQISANIPAPIKPIPAPSQSIKCAPNERFLDPALLNNPPLKGKKKPQKMNIPDQIHTTSQIA